MLVDYAYTLQDVPKTLKYGPLISEKSHFEIRHYPMLPPGGAHRQYIAFIMEGVQQGPKRRAEGPKAGWGFWPFGESPLARGSGRTL